MIRRIRKRSSGIIAAQAKKLPLLIASDSLIVRENAFYYKEAKRQHPCRHEKSGIGAPLLMLSGRLCLQVFAYGCHEGFFWLEADHFVYRLTIFEDDQGRDGHNAKTACGIRVVVNVYFDDFELGAHFSVDLLQDRSDHFARAAPRSPEVNQDSTALLYFLGKVLVSCIYDCHGKLPPRKVNY
jgi:hypothetical protein